MKIYEGGAQETEFLNPLQGIPKGSLHWEPLV